MKFQTYVMVLASSIAVVVSFGGSEDKFLKKYAMMKIYESCFGEGIVRQIRKEMKLACAKCQQIDIPAPPAAPIPEEKPQGDEIPSQNSVFNNQQGFDAEKLHQAILAFRPNVPQPSFRPYSGMNPGNFYNTPFANPSFSAAPPMYFPGYQQYPFPYNFPVVGQPYYGHRMARDMDIRSHIDALTAKMSGRVRNVTCVMQELGYLDDNLEPNYIKIQERIANLPVDDELRKDMQEGVSFCQEFSQCVPDVKKEKSPLSRELIRPMFFFKCYKHKKLEACIMKDVREKFSGVSDDELDGDMDLRRTGKAAKLPDNEKDLDDMASAMYDFLYTSDSGLDEDGLL